jgi:hypothetical protein
MGSARARLAGLLVVLLLAPGAAARGICASQQPLRAPWFGDTHVHTAFSQDASTQGTRNGPREAYRFARGEPLGIQPYDAADRALRSLRLARPLDFAVVTDHAEQLGEVEICSRPGLPGHDALVCRLYRWWPRLSFFLMNMRATYWENPTRFDFCGPGGVHCLAAAHGPWQEIQAAAEAAQDRSSACRFTSFVGYEWTGATGSKNLHRNVIFRNEAVPDLPASYFEASTPEALWDALERDCLAAGSGCDALVIPHNSNLSGGLMFEARRADGTPLDRTFAERRARFEPLAEVMQHKGDSECRLDPGGEDELCAFEKLPYDDFQGKYVPWLATEPRDASFVRDALRRGLLEETRVGANPFRFGLIASTDTHLAAPGAADERGYAGHGGAGAPAAAALPVGLPDDLEFNPGGLAVLWAEENSREALFAAMRRREAYGTSGTRPVVRFFGGFELQGDLCEREDFAAIGYSHGVPMGGVLPTRSAAPPPRFALRALRDPAGAPLQRLQIVKGWAEGSASQERVYEVAGDPENGASVDLTSCAPRGAGFDALCTVWEDPAFDAAAPAFYYARVVENPTCRWSAHLCVDAGVDCERPDTIGEGFEPCCAADHRRTIQERAWTSPIWYAP